MLFVVILILFDVTDYCLLDGNCSISFSPRSEKITSGADQFSFDRRGANFSGGVHWCTTKCMKFD